MRKLLLLLLSLLLLTMPAFAQDDADASQNEIVLVDEAYEAEDFKMTIPYPEGWTISTPDTDLDANLAFNELESDIGSGELPVGIVMDFGQIAVASLPGDATLDVIINVYHENSIDWETAQPQGEFVVIGQSGIAFSGTDADQAYHFYVLTIDQSAQVITVWHLRSPDEARLNETGPVFMTMLSSAVSTEVIASADIIPIDPDKEPVNPAELDLAGTPDEICEQATPAIEPDTREYQVAEQVLDEGVDYQVIMCTDIGAIHIELFEGQTPITANNMAFLASNNYYNNTIFHRVMDGFMAQGGDPTGSGRGGPGYQFGDEILPELTFDRPYLLAMANAGPGTNGSQFFITFAPTEWLDGNHTIFGEVLSGQDVVDNIMLRDPQNPSAPATTLRTLLIVTPDVVTEVVPEPELVIDYSQIPQGRTEDNAFILGSPDAPITIVVWEDYLCPHCQDYHVELNPFIADYVATGLARFEFRMLPISQTSPAIFGLAECAEVLQENSFWDAHNYLFTTMHDEGLREELPNDFAEAMGLPLDELMACVEDATQYQTDSELAMSFSDDNGQQLITGTPTVGWRLNGSEVRFDVINRRPTYDELAALVAEFGEAD